MRLEQVFERVDIMSKIRDGYYSAIYFLKTANILKHEKPDDMVTIQFFQRENNVILAGIKDCLELLRNESYEYETLSIWSLNDGDVISAKEPVLKIAGSYWKFGHLEGLIDGILARQSSIATNVKAVIDVANNKPLIYMNDRSDYYINQENDGYAANIGGIINFVTKAQLNDWNKETIAIGTMPHALIQAYQGDLISALYAYQKHYSQDKLTALIDYNNDVINDGLKVAQEFNDQLYAVRVDTSPELIDKYFQGKEDEYQDEKINGVNPYLIKALRKALDEQGFDHVKIIVSSGFNVQKIQYFEQQQTPVDIYGVGQTLGKIWLGFTGDCVLLNEIEQAKHGRKNIVSKRLKMVK